ncbi:hypothetical protein ASG84_24645 [Rhodococcus sp. Leaf278]|nr:hypothetical protein ASG84_24645 [Rhodococcus sp. Leaf278]
MLFDVIRGHHSDRKFLPTPMSVTDIEEVLADASIFPNANTINSWTVHVVSGARRSAHSKRTLGQFDSVQQPPILATGYADATCSDHAKNTGPNLHGVPGDESPDIKLGQEMQPEYLRFHGAPHVAFLFMPITDDEVRTADDVGAYAHAFLLALESRGYYGVLQTLVPAFADEVRDVLGVSDELELSFALSFGSVDPDDPISAPVDAPSSHCRHCPSPVPEVTAHPNV